LNIADWTLGAALVRSVGCVAFMGFLFWRGRGTLKREYETPAFGAGPKEGTR
jgi:hypothetical protein